MIVVHHKFFMLSSNQRKLILQLEKKKYRLANKLFVAEGKKVNYEGATGVEFTDVGEAFGSFLEKEINNGKFETKKQR